MDYPVSDPTNGLVGGKFTDGNPGAGIPASRDPSSWANLLTDELLAILSAAGIAPSEIITNQIAIAIQSGKLNSAVDTGAVNAYVCAFTPVVLALTDGLALSFEAVNSNTGASTLNVNGLGAHPVLGGAHAALQGGEIIAGGKVVVMWSAALASFVLLNQTGGAVQVAAATKSSHAINLGQFTGANQALSSSGYQKLPGGLILQWVQVSGASGDSNVTALPITFPTAVLARTALLLDKSSGVTAGLTLFSNALKATTSSIQLTLKGWDTGGWTASYIALGY